MTRLDILNLLTAHAKKHRDGAANSIQRNAHMNDLSAEELEQFLALGPEIYQKMIDAILVDFINSIAANQGVDYGLYTKDLRN